MIQGSNEPSRDLHPGRRPAPNGSGAMQEDRNNCPRCALLREEVGKPASSFIFGKLTRLKAGQVAVSLTHLPHPATQDAIEHARR